MKVTAIKQVNNMVFAKYECEDEKGLKPGGQDMISYPQRGLLLAKAIEQSSARGPGTQWGSPHDCTGW